MKEISFVVRGNPMSQKRHRHTKRGHTYDPSSQDKQAFLMTVQAEAPSTPIDSPIAMDAVLYFPIPKSTPKYKKIEMEKGLYPMTKTPDADNCGKFICDALNGIFYLDDKLIYSLGVRKYYDAVPRTEVRLIYDIEREGKWNK